MNRTNWEHAGIAAGLMLAVFLPLALLAVPGAPLIAFAVAVTWFLARECTQHEYKLGMARGWSRDSLLDWLTPLGVCLLLYALQTGAGVFLT